MNNWRLLIPVCALVVAGCASTGGTGSDGDGAGAGGADGACLQYRCIFTFTHGLACVVYAVRGEHMLYVKEPSEEPNSYRWVTFLLFLLLDCLSASMFTIA